MHLKSSCTKAPYFETIEFQMGNCFNFQLQFRPFSFPTLLFFKAPHFTLRSDSNRRHYSKISRHITPLYRVHFCFVGPAPIQRTHFKSLFLKRRFFDDLWIFNRRASVSQFFMSKVPSVPLFFHFSVANVRALL